MSVETDESSDNSVLKIAARDFGSRANYYLIDVLNQ